MAGIYLHIPFCKQACHYCDFHFSTSIDIKDELIACMDREIIIQQDYLKGALVESVYFGGGTPSFIDVQDIESLLKTIRSTQQIAPHAEITLEANPDDLSESKLAALRLAGINRLSIGIQSFDDHVLQYLHRAHHADAAFQSVKSAQNAGFQNISIDLIYAIPNQSHDAWRSNVSKAISLNPQHISAYTLTIEEKTAFGKWYRQGKLNVVDDETAATQLDVLVEDLENAGFEQYEVSNFCKPGFESKHNSSYWKQKPYLGIGPGAHSYNLSTRQYNVRNNHLYVKALKTGEVPSECETLTIADQANEYLLTTLRTRWGCNLNTLAQQFNYEILLVHDAYIKSLIDKNLAIIKNNYLVLTKKGRFVADKIASDLFLDD